MPSIFNSSDNASIVQRINSLSPESTAHWGKMNVQQMLEHCTRPIDLATGATTMKRGLLAILFGRLAKRSLVSPKPLAHNAPTAPEFVVRETPVFEVARTALIARVENLAKGGPGVLIKGPHPFFGKLTQDEWDLLQWKHLDHHLRQFGA